MVERERFRKLSLIGVGDGIGEVGRLPGLSDVIKGAKKLHKFDYNVSGRNRGLNLSGNR